MLNKGIDDSDQIEDIALEWLDKCAEIRRLEHSRRYFTDKIRRRIADLARDRILPMRFEILQQKNPELWKKLSGMEL